MRRISFLLLALTGCSAPTYDLDEAREPSFETFQCGGYLEDEDVQYYYYTVIFKDTSIFVTGAVSNGTISSSGTHSYAPGESDPGPVTVYKDGWITMSLVMIPELGVKFSREERNWVQLGGCTHAFQ
jgi:hypothetical protein